MARRGAKRRGANGLAALLMLGVSGCSTGTSIKNFLVGGNPAGDGPVRLAGFLGGIAADEPRAALAGRDVLARGGNAADAAVAIGFMLSATLPSRASLGAGGACLAYDPRPDGPSHGVPEAVLFTPIAGAPGDSATDRPAAVPMLARGLFLLQARYGSGVAFEQLISPAEQAAHFGAPVSRALAADLAEVATPLLADPNARAIFGNAMHEGDTLVQGDLGASLAQIRVAGVGDLYQGQLAGRFATASAEAGGRMPLETLRLALPHEAPAIVLPSGNDQVAFLPPPADGGLAAAAAFQALALSPQAVQAAQNAATSVVAYSRANGGDPKVLLATNTPPASLPVLPASTSFTVLDRRGGAVACALTMDNLFGTGRVAPGTGIVLAAAPRPAAAPLLAAAIAWNDNLHAFRAAAAGSGQSLAGLAVGMGMHNALAGTSPMPDKVPNPGRLNAIGCSRYLPGSQGSCAWASDPRGYGLSAGSTE